MYTCAHCGAKAAIQNGVVVRTCPHDKAPVTANMKAHATGQSKVS